MNFEAGNIYHVYNRGNNKSRIFFKDGNYLFFLKKVLKELSPYLNFISYCLMPNHFHFLVQAKGLNLNDSSDDSKSSDEYSKQISNQIAILLRSYTRAINIQENRTGSLFQQKTKAKCLNELNTSTNNYITTCFFYIHQNPLDARLVNKLEDWEYSSFKEYTGLRNNGFCDHNLAFELINLDRENFIEQTYAVIEKKYLKGIWL